MKAKHFLYLTFAFFLIPGCSKDNDPGMPDPDPDPQNNPPTTFDLIQVADGATNVDTAPTLSWQAATDPDGDAVVYDLYLDTAANPAIVQESNISETSYEVTDRLQWLTDYHWKVVAKDGKGGETESDTFGFTTRDVAFFNTPVTANADFPARHWHTSTVFDGKMWVIGGFDGNYYNDVWYSSDGINWTEATPAADFSARYGHSTVVFDDKIWVIGGYDGSRKNDVWYSSDGIHWVEATPTAGFVERYDHTTITFDGKLWVIGGYTTSYQNDVWHSSDGVTWTAATTLIPFSGRSAHTTTVFDNKLWVIGGFNGVDMNDVWYSSDGVNWTEATSDAAFSERREHIAAAFADRLWVISGFKGGTNGGYNTEVWHSPDGINWTEASSEAPFSERIGHTVVVFDNRLWVIGGSYEGAVMNDVWAMD